MKTSAVHYAVRARHRGNSSSAGKIVKRVSSRLRQQYAERSRTKTQTTTKKKSLFHKVRNDGPMSNSFTRWPQRLSSFKLGKLQKLISPQIIVSNQATRLEAPIGKQDFIRYGTAEAPV